MFDVLAAGFVIGLTHAMPPGPITFEVIRRGVSEGFASALKVNAGAMAADAVFFLLVTIGLSQALSYSAGKIALWLGGCALLAFLGARGVYRIAMKKTAALSDRPRGDSPLAAGFLICITSPFAIAWWTAVFASTIAFIGDTWSLAGLFGGIAAACLLWYAALGLLGSASKKMFRPSWLTLLSLACSLMMLAFAAVLLYRGYAVFL